jgi:hypothetical protein
MELNNAIYTRIHEIIKSESEVIKSEEIEFLNKIAKEAKEELDAMIPECPKGEKFKEIKEAIDKGYKYFNFSYYSDMYPGIITKVINQKTIEVLELDHFVDIRKKHKYGIGYQNWLIYRNDNIDSQGNKHIFTLRKNGRWVKKGSIAKDGLHGNICNEPEYYYNWSF